MPDLELRLRIAEAWGRWKGCPTMPCWCALTHSGSLWFVRCNLLLHMPSQVLLQTLCAAGMARFAHGPPPPDTLTLVLWSLASLASGQGGGVVRSMLASHAPLLHQLVMGVHCAAYRCVYGGEGHRTG